MIQILIVLLILAQAAVIAVAGCLLSYGQYRPALLALMGWSFVVAVALCAGVRKVPK